MGRGRDMYGLVNTAIQQLITEKFGDGSWETVTEKAGIEDEIFVSMDPYDDSVTYAVVGAVCEVTGLNAEQVLEAFGEYWVLYTAERGYGPILQMAGKSFREFLQNLDQLHTRVASTFPELVPPSFELVDLKDQKMALHYRSTREGLAPMVRGLLIGLAHRFKISISIDHTEEKAKGAEHDVFVLTET